MTREDAINYMLEHPFAKVSHKSFAKDEYLYSQGGNKIYSEKGCLFETWDNFDKIHNGFRLRMGEEWQNGWFVKEKIEKLTIRENKKFVRRYLKPLLFECCPIYTDAQYIGTPEDSVVLVERNDGERFAIDVSNLGWSQITMKVISNLFNVEGNYETKKN